MPLQRNVLLALSLLLFLAVVVNVVLASGNRTSQAEVAQRQQFIQQTVGLERLNQEIVKALAELAVRNQDRDVTALLNANGVTFSVGNAGAAASGGAAGASSKTGK